MKKNLTILVILTMILSFVIGFVACGPKNEPTGDDAGDGGDDGDGGATMPDELKDVQYLDMVSVTGGTFTQKDTDGNEFDHTISEFSIGKYEVTYELWYNVYTWATANGYTFANDGMEGHDGNDGAEPTDDAKYEPVTKINWRDAIVWCNAYSELMGYTPVYTYSGAVLKDSSDPNESACNGATMDMSKNGYRLPTEGEWQFAASKQNDGTYQSFNWASGATASGATACDSVAWYDDNSGDSTHAVGGKGFNGLGLHDMSGNVWEWCWDWKGDYPSDSQTDYVGAETSFSRIFRGGSWFFGSSFLRVGYRHDLGPHLGLNNLGFRVSRRP